MTITGKHLISGQWLGNTQHGFFAINAVENKPIPTPFADATSIEVEQAISAAQQSFSDFSQLSATKRANFLRSIGEQVLALGDELVTTACAETGLPAMRIQGERGRTISQLNLFADVLEHKEYQGVIDNAQPDREPLPKPDTRLGYLPLGVVAVFGASNFPLAFSTVGGDTVSALAAGCPVIMKAHSSHPGTSELMAKAVLAAIKLCNIDMGVFSLIQGKNHGISSQIITHPMVKAVGFTGSERVGMIFQQQINQRAEPIPFYGELGSVNPQFILDSKLNKDANGIAKALVDSLMMGQGQFCTSPGVWFVIENKQFSNFSDTAATEISKTHAGVMLTPGIAATYQDDVNKWQLIEGVDMLAQGIAGVEHFCQAALFSTNIETFTKEAVLRSEVFGSSALIVRCKDFNEMLQGIDLLSGNLTASIHADNDDIEQAKAIASAISHKVGRLIYNQMPTGVEVCASMNHGGPFPASTNIRSTSVGSEAIKRFQRPICYQNMPDELLPILLQRN